MTNSTMNTEESGEWNWIIKNEKTTRQHSTYCRAGFGGSPTADSRIAVPCPSDRNALRNPPRQHVPTVTANNELRHLID